MYRNPAQARMPSGRPSPQTVRFSKEYRCERRAHCRFQGRSASPRACTRCSAMFASHWSLGKQTVERVGLEDAEGQESGDATYDQVEGNSLPARPGSAVRAGVISCQKSLALCLVPDQADGERAWQ